MEKWVTLAVFETEVLVCDACDTQIINQVAYMYVNSDNDVEEVLCERCWKKEDIK